MKGKFAIDIMAALSLIKAENVSALRELTKRVLLWISRRVSGQTKIIAKKKQEK